jgi:hypothetical protein
MGLTIQDLFLGPVPAICSLESSPSFIVAAVLAELTLLGQSASDDV